MDASNWRTDYKGPICEKASQLFDQLVNEGFLVEPSHRANSKNKTLRISLGGQDLGFFNQDVKKHECVFGFAFEENGKANDAWPIANREVAKGAIERLASQLCCQTDKLVCREDKGRFFFYLTTPEVAKRAVELRRSGVQISVC